MWKLIVMKVIRLHVRQYHLLNGIYCSLKVLKLYIFVKNFELVKDVKINRFTEKKKITKTSRYTVPWPCRHVHYKRLCVLDNSHRRLDCSLCLGGSPTILWRSPSYCSLLPREFSSLDLLQHQHNEMLLEKGLTITFWIDRSEQTVRQSVKAQSDQGLHLLNPLLYCKISVQFLG